MVLTRAQPMRAIGGVTSSFRPEANLSKVAKFNLEVTCAEQRNVTLHQGRP